MPYRENCVKCPKSEPRHAVLKWTLYNGQVAVVAPLCMEHGYPLSEIVNIVGPRPLLQTGAMPVTPERRVKVRVSPIEGWTKPEDD